MSDLPKFRYHPDPVRSRVIEVSDTQCVCCGQARGQIYTGPVYSEEDGMDDSICPWCIADGSAAKKFDATFTDCYWLKKQGVRESVIEEVSRRTPGFISWQSEQWLACCDDACAFMGDATKSDVDSLEDTERDALVEDAGIEEDELDEVIENYRPGGSPAIYKFSCLHCGKNQYHMDMD